MFDPDAAFLIATKRLILRPLDPQQDLAALHRIGGDARVAAMMQSLKTGWSLDEAAEFLERARWRGKPGFRHAVALRSAPGALIGTVGIGGDPVSTAYFIDPDHWGQGIATEAMAAFLAAAMGRFDIADITAGHFADNPASGAVLRKLGFVRDGEELGTNAARLEPARILLYRLERAQLKADDHEIP